VSAYTNWKVKVRKSYTEIVEVSAVTSDEAYEEARNIYGVVLVEEVIWDDPELEKPSEEGLRK